MEKERTPWVGTLRTELFETIDAARQRFDRRRMGRMERPDGYGRITGVCGDTMEVFLRFVDGRVREASFQTDGCGTSIASGSCAAGMAVGKDPDELLDVTGEAVLERLGGLPEESRHCAFLAAATVQEALDDYMKRETRARKE